MSDFENKPVRDKAALAEYTTVFGAAFAVLYLINFRDGIFIWALGQQEGAIWVDEAYRMLQGELIYRDFFDFVGPVVTFVDYLFLRLLGPTTTSVGLMVVTVGAANATALYAISSVILSRAWRMVPAAVFVGITYTIYSPGNHKWPTILLCSLGILAVLRAQSRLRCAISGMMIGCATLSTQDYGVGAAVGMWCSLWLLRGRAQGADPWAFALAYAQTGLSAFVVLGLAAGFGNVWYDLFLFLFEQYGASHFLGVYFGDLENLPIWLSSMGLGLLGFAYTLVGLARRFWRKDDPSVVVLAVTGSGLLVVGGMAHPIDRLYIAVEVIPLTIVGVHVLQMLVERRVLHPLPLISVLAIALVIVWRAVSEPAGATYANARHLEEYRAGKIWATRHQEEVAWLEANTVEGQRVFLFPDKGGLSFLTHTRNATSFPMMLDIGFNSEGQVRKATKELEANCPQIGIWDWNRLISFVAKRDDWFTLRPLWQYIERTYDPVEKFPNGSVGFRRKSDTGCG
jgi:hypothetical protein